LGSVGKSGVHLLSFLFGGAHSQLHRACQLCTAVALESNRVRYLCGRNKNKQKDHCVYLSFTPRPPSRIYDQTSVVRPLWAQQQW
jgi:hypothetical protein